MKVLVLFILCFNAWAGELRFTPPGMTQVKGPHQALWPADQGNGLLMISINGTGADPQGLVPFGETVVKMGYHKLGIDYPNGVIPTVCKHSTNPQCYDFYQRELVLGEQVSYEVNINPTDAVLPRLLVALKFLVQKDPVRWGRFWKNNQPVWEKIVLYGHSQGACHAAYLSKLYSVHGVFLTGGPFAYMPEFGFAQWPSLPGATDPSRYLALLHKTDYFGSDEHAGVMKLLVGEARGQVTMIGNTLERNFSGQVFMSQRPERDGHNAIIIDQRYAGVWESFLASFNIIK